MLVGVIVVSLFSFSLLEAKFNRDGEGSGDDDGDVTGDIDLFVEDEGVGLDVFLPEPTS